MAEDGDDAIVELHVVPFALPVAQIEPLNRHGPEFMKCLTSRRLTNQMKTKADKAISQLTELKARFFFKPV